MANDFPGPYSPEQLAQIASYYGVPDVNMSAAPPAPAPPPVDTGAYYNYNPEPDLPPAGPPPPPIRPVGAQISQIGDPQGHAFATGTLGGAAPAAPPGPGGGLDAADIVAGSPGFQGRSAADIRAGKPAPAPPPIPSGPSAQDDREYAAFRKLQEGQGHKPAAHGGSGAPANPDPYGVKGARNALLGTYDTEGEALQRQATAEGDRAAMVGDRRTDLARQQQEDAAIHAAELDEAQRGFDAHMSELQRQVDEVRAKKIDPDRLMKTDGMAARAVVGGVIGGLYMGLNHLDHNPFLDDLNRQIDRDIAAQEKDIDNERHGVADKMTLLSQQRAAFKDHDLAKLATRSAMYEATKNAIEAEAAQYEQPLVQACADQALAALTREKDKNDLAFKTQAQQQAAAAAAAQAAHTRALQTEMRKSYGDTYEKLIASGANPATAEAEAIRQTQNMFRGGAGDRAPSAAGAGSDPIANVPKDQRPTAEKEMEEHAHAAAAIKNIDHLFTTWTSTGVTSPRQIASIKAGIAGAYKSGLGPGMSSDKDFEAFIEPNIPAIGDSAETLARKRANIAATINGKVATPTLDRHNPGWRPRDIQQFDVGTGKPL